MVLEVQSVSRPSKGALQGEIRPTSTVAHFLAARNPSSKVPSVLLVYTRTWPKGNARTSETLQRTRHPRNWTPHRALLRISWQRNSGCDDEFSVFLVTSRHALLILILFSGNRQIPGLATGAVGTACFTPVVSGFSPPRGRFVDTTEWSNRLQGPVGPY